MIIIIIIVIINKLNEKRNIYNHSINKEETNQLKFENIKSIKR